MSYSFKSGYKPIRNSGDTVYLSVTQCQNICILVREQTQTHTHMGKSYKVHWINPLKPSGHYMYRQFNIQQFYALPEECSTEDIKYRSNMGK
jgi:hypothetical protein